MAPHTASTHHGTQSQPYGGPGPTDLGLHDLNLYRHSSTAMMDDDIQSVATLSTRSAVMPRSISNGAIAGAVVGSVVGACLILLCLLPFILRAIRERAARRRHGDLDGPPMTTAPDFGLAPPIQPDESRRLSVGQLFQSASATNELRPLPTKEFGVNGTAGDHKLEFGDDAHPAPATAEPFAAAQSISTPGQNGLASGGGPSPIGTSQAVAAGENDFTSQPTSPIVPVGLPLTATQSDPTALDLTPTNSHPPGHPHHRFHVGVPHAVKHIAEAIRRGTHSSADSRGDAPTRSPTWDQDQYLTPSLSAPMILEPSYGDDPNGAAYSYYHDPDILSESPTSQSPVQQFPVADPPASSAAQAGLYSMGFSSVPAGIAGIPRSELSGLPNQAPRVPLPYSPRSKDSPVRAPSPEIKQEPEDESTVSPGTPIARDADLAHAALAKGRLQELKTEALDGDQSQKKPLRMDTLPLTGITADSPTSGPGVVDLPAPSINPMAIMPASNHTEQTHRVKHELDVIAHSPPPPQFAANVIEPSDAISEPDEDVGDPQDLDMLDISDYSTPPAFSHSSGPSIENTPDTRVSDTFTASPSPRPPMYEFGEMPNGEHAGQLSPMSPQRFQCERCSREFDQIHKLNHHRRYHERPHECPHKGCDMRFGTKTHLDRHINDKHDKRRKYFCMVPDCPYSRQGGKAFPRKDNWRRHMQNKHQITPDTEPGPEFTDELMGDT